MNIRVAIYARISKDRSGLSVNTGIQLRECQQYAAAEDWHVVAEYEENDVSASRYSRQPRPLYEQLLSLVRAGQVDVILATESERLMRRPDEMSELIRIADNGRPIVIELTSGERYDLRTANGVYEARGSTNRGERESRKISERTKRKKAANAREGKPSGGRRPYGYNYIGGEFTINEPEAAVLREMGGKIISGWSAKEVAKWANEHGHLTTMGKPWASIMVRNKMLKPLYGGYRQYYDELFPAQWEPVFDPVTWERLQLTMASRARIGAAPNLKYLLTRLLYCGLCGGRMNGSKHTDKRRREQPTTLTYACYGCHKIRVNAEALDHFITECVLYRLDTADLAALLDDNEDDGKLRELIDAKAAKELRKAELADMLGSGDLSTAEFRRAKATNEAELERLELAIAQTQRKRSLVHVPAGQTVRQAWDNSPSLEWKRGLLSLLIKRIDINPDAHRPVYMVNGKKTRFTPDRVVVTWIA